MWKSDTTVNDCAGLRIVVARTFHQEESRVDALVDNDECEFGFCQPHGHKQILYGVHFVVETACDLSIADTVTIEEDLFGKCAMVFPAEVELLVLLDFNVIKRRIEILT